MAHDVVAIKATQPKKSFWDWVLCHKLKYDVRMDFKTYNPFTDYHYGSRIGCKKCKVELDRMDWTCIRKFRIRPGLTPLGWSVVVGILWKAAGLVWLWHKIW